MGTAEASLAKPRTDSNRPSLPLVGEHALGAVSFSVEKFVDSFPLLVGAAGGSVQLRFLVLELSVRGILTATDAMARRAVSPVGEGALIDFPATIPMDWRVARLENLVEPTRPISYGVLMPGPHEPNGVPLVKSQNILNRSVDPILPTLIARKLDDEFRRTKLVGGEVLVNVVGSVGRCAVAPPAWAGANVSRAVAVVVPNKSVNAEFLCVLLARFLSEARVRALVTGTAQPVVNIKTLRSVLLPVPPLAEQKRIVARVDQLMALIDDLEASQTKKRDLSTRFTKASLETLTTAEFPEAFDTAWQRVLENFPSVVDSAEKVAEMRAAILGLALCGRLVTHQVASSASSEMRAHKPDVQPVGGTDCPYGLPGHWGWYRLRDVLGSLTDGDHQAPPQVSVGVPFLTIGNVSKGALEFDGARAVPRSYFEALEARRVPKQGDILYTVVGATYGRPILVDQAREFCVQRHIAILRPDGTVDRAYLYLYLRSSLAYDQATNSTTGTAQPTVPLKPLREFKVPVPPLAEQKRIVAKVEQLMKLCDNLEAKLRRAEDRASKLVEAVVQQMVS